MMDLYTLPNDSVMKVHVEAEVHPNLLSDGPVSSLPLLLLSVYLDVMHEWLLHPLASPTTF